MNYGLLCKEAGKFAQLSMEISESGDMSSLLAHLRAASHLHQTHHWQSKGSPFFGDHLLFERLYNESQPFIDEVAERAIGEGSDDMVDALEQINLMQKTLASFKSSSSQEEMIAKSLKMEKDILELAKSLLDGATPGTSNLLEGLCDKHEQFVYLLQQRIK